MPPSDTYTLIISDSGTQTLGAHASTHVTGGTDQIPAVTLNDGTGASRSGLMTPAMLQILNNTVSNATHTGDAAGSTTLTVTGINNTNLATLGTGILKLTNGVPSLATTSDFPSGGGVSPGVILGVTQGGTGISTYAVGDILYASAADTLTKLSGNTETTRKFLSQTGTGAASQAPTWRALLDEDLPATISKNTTGLAARATSLAGGSTYAVPYQSAANQTAFVTGGVNGYVLTYDDLLGPKWSSSQTVQASINPGSITSTELQTATNTTTGISLDKIRHQPAYSLLARNSSVAGAVTALNSSADVFTFLQAADQTAMRTAIGLSTPIGVGSGGTGLQSLTVGAMLYASASGTLSQISPGSSGQYLKSNGPSFAPEWANISVGTIPISQGGTGQTTFADGYLRVQTVSGSKVMSTVASVGNGFVTLDDPETLTNKTIEDPIITDSSGDPVDGLLWFDDGQLAEITNGTSGYVLTSTGTTTAPTWQAAAAASLPSLTGNENRLLSVNATATAVEWASAADTRTKLGLDTIATQPSNNVTITGGSISGITLGAASGGTGQTSYTVGDLLYASAATTLSKLAGVATGNALISGGTSTAPSWGKIGLSTHVSGTLPIANGGTGQTTAGGAIQALLPSYTSNANKVLTLNGTADGLTWTTAGVTNLALGTATATAQPITNSNGTGFTLPAAIASTAAGLLTAADKTKLDGIQAGAEVNVNADWNSSSGDSQILNKPTLGEMAAQNRGSVNITGGSITGITDLAVADGGTGASNAAGARGNLLPGYAGNGGKVLAVNTGATDVEWVTPSTSVTLSSVPSPTTVAINPASGSGATIEAATGTNAGILLPAQKLTLDRVSRSTVGASIGGAQPDRIIVSTTNGGLWNISSIQRVSSQVTVTTSTTLDNRVVVGQSVTVSGTTDTSFSGTFTVTSLGPNVIRYNQSAADATETGTGNISAAPTITERMRITSGGYVGIGTNAPAYALDVVGDVGITGGLNLGVKLPIAQGGHGGSTLSEARSNLLPSYTGNASKFLAVNTSANNIEWASPFPSLTSNAGKSLVVNSGATGVEWTTPTPTLGYAYRAASYSGLYNLFGTSAVTDAEVPFTTGSAISHTTISSAGLTWNSTGHTLTNSTGRTIIIQATAHVTHSLNNLVALDFAISGTNQQFARVRGGPNTGSGENTTTCMSTSIITSLSNGQTLQLRHTHGAAAQTGPSGSAGGSCVNMNVVVIG